MYRSNSAQLVSRASDCARQNRHVLLDISCKNKRVGALSGLFSELKRRNVFRVTGVYAAVGWLVAQIAALSANSFGAPDWVMKMVIVALLIGIPIVMICAWAFEMTPEGVKRTDAVDADDSITDKTGRKLDYAILGGLVLVAGLAVFQMSRPSASTSTQASTAETTPKQAVAEEGKSIAVQPFVNMSSDEEQEYFADGISEEILNMLVRIPDLKVAGRTSSFSFKGKNEDLRIIGEALNVNHILEGSVRRSGTRLRITAQLIRSEDGFHLWSDTYDREIADIFDIQDEIAKEVADQLAISLGLDSKHKIHERTTDLIAYENYLKANQLFLQRGRGNLDEALALLNDVTTRDPEFAPAQSLVASIYTIYQSFASDDEYRANREKWFDIGKNAAVRALELDPDSAEALGALGFYAYYNFDFIKAYEHFDQALELEPNNPIVLDILAQAGLDVGYLDEARQHITKAIALDPLVAVYQNIQGWSYGAIGDRENALASLEKAMELDPTLPYPYRITIVLYANPTDIDKFPFVMKRAVDAGAFSAETPDWYEPVLNFIKDRSTMSEEDAMQRFREHPGPKRRTFPARYLGDVDEWITIREKFDWNSDYRGNPELFRRIVPGIYAHKRLKQQVRKDGVLALWQSRGFPAHCKPVGGDDFKCE